MAQRYHRPPVPDRAVASSNSTSNYFLGGQSRPWMGNSNHIPSHPSQPPNPSAIARAPSRNPSSPLELTPTQGSSLVPALLTPQLDQIEIPQTLLDPSTQTFPPTSHLTTPSIPTALGRSPSTQVGTHQLDGPSEHMHLDLVSPHPTPPVLQTPSYIHTPGAPMTSPTDAAILWNGPHDAAWPPTANPLPQMPSTMVPARQPPQRHPLPTTSAPRALSGIPTTQLPTPNNSPLTHPKNPLTIALESALDPLKRAAQWETPQDAQIDSMRVQMLRDACCHNDMFYLTLHSIYMLATSSRQDLIQSLALAPAHFEGLSIVDALLGSNHLLTSQIHDLFMTFPCPLDAFLRQQLPLVHDIKNFLSHLSYIFPVLRDQAKARGSPPCPSELSYRLRTTSPVLQKAFFLSIIRDWPIDFEWQQRALWLFDYWSDPARVPLKPTSLSQVQGITFEFARHCHQLRAQYLRDMSSVVQAQPPADNQSAQMPSQHRQIVPQSLASAPSLPQTSPPAPLPQHRLHAITTTNPLHPHPAPTIPPGHVLAGRSQPVRQPQSNNPSHISQVHRTQEQTRSQTQLQAHDLPFFPNNHYYRLPTLVQPLPRQTAAHQALTSSPKYNITDADAGSTPQARLYRYIENIIMLPQTFHKDAALFRWQVTIPSPLLFTKVKPPKLVGSFLSPESDVMSGSSQFRLKCMKQVLDGDSDPAFLPAYWPAFISISVNGDFNVDIRRKAHYGTDMSTDITHLLLDGENEIAVGITFSPQEANVTYLVGIEVIRIKNHASVAAMAQHLPSANVKASIAAAIAADGDGDDDDLVVADPGVSIFLVDPITSQMWLTPVRSQKCQHRECFDLEAFLLSRTSRSKGSTLTNPVQWKCPICNQDARPQNLIIDHFLVQVRQSLEERNLMETRTILVKEDGNWEIRGETLSSSKPNKSSVNIKPAASTPTPDRVKTDQTESTRRQLDVYGPSSADNGPEIITINDD